MLFFKRQVEQLQQQHTALQDALQDNSFLVQSLQAKIVALEADIVELEQKNTKE
jgi:predicted  nucleic acid-binding Zn-ribbon protein